MTPRVSRPGRRAPPGTRGVAALEFALLAPVFFTLVLGGVFYGLYMVTSIAVMQVAADGARAAVAGLTNAERTSLAQAAATASLATYASLLSPSLTTITAQAVPGNARLFQVQVTYNFLASGFPTILPLPASNPVATDVVSMGGY